MTRPGVAGRDRYESLLEARPNGCIEFTGPTSGKGYGRLYIDGKIWWTHRYAWVDANGPIPDGLHVLHDCDNTVCCNPDHLSLGTNADNVADKMSKGRYRGNGWKFKTHCIHGHEYAATGVYVRPNGWRECQACRGGRAASRRVKTVAA